MGDGRAAAGGHNSPLGAGDLCQALADSVHQLIHVDEAARSLVHGALHFWKRLRTGNDGEGAARINHGPNADGAVHVGSKIHRGRYRLTDTSAEGLCRGEESTLPEEIAAAESCPRFFEL